MNVDSGYEPLFDPAATASAYQADRILRRGDEAPAGGYVYDSDGRIALAVNVALATGRPLLVRGKPGSGKSSLAADVAAKLGWRYYEETVTSRTRARDLLWSFDAIRRLNDANIDRLKDPLAYVTPGVLWWAFSASSASSRGLPADALSRRKLRPLADPSPRGGDRAVVLLDEIDKADPDVPNDLLQPLGALKFKVADVDDGPAVTAPEAPLLIITTNEDRDLPQAFVRRCVVLGLPDPKPGRLLEVAAAHFGGRVPEERLKQVLAAYQRVREKRAPEDHEPNLAEYLDTVAAVAALGVQDQPQWDQVVEFTLSKPAPDGVT
jgi:MoxR-like ATPase